MVLSEKEIRTYVADPNAPLITPFSEDQLQGASYDISMSDAVIVLKNIGCVIDPSETGNLDRMYDMRIIDNSGYLLSPGEYVLVKLRGTICLPPDLIAHIRPRTRFTRCGILIANQHCNPTYEGVLSIGLYNAGANPFILRPNLRVAQMIFEKISSVPGEEKLYKNKANAAYSQEKDFRGSKFGEAGWTDELKKAYTDMKAALLRGE